MGKAAASGNGGDANPKRKREEMNGDDKDLPDGKRRRAMDGEEDKEDDSSEKTAQEASEKTAREEKTGEENSSSSSSSNTSESSRKRTEMPILDILDRKFKMAKERDMTKLDWSAIALIKE